MTPSIGQVICDAIYEADTWGRYPTPSQLRSVDLRPGLAEIDVIYVEQRDDEEQRVYVTIPSKDVLSTLLQQALEREVMS